MNNINVGNSFSYDGTKITVNFIFSKSDFLASEITSISVYPPNLVNYNIKDLVKRFRQGVGLCFTLKNGREIVTNSVNVNRYYKELRDFLVNITKDHPSISLDTFITDIIKTEAYSKKVTIFSEE